MWHPSNGASQTELLEQLTLRLAWLEMKQLALDLAPHGLTTSQAFALMMLERVGQVCPMTDLADAACRSQGTMTGIIDRLVRMGLVQRTQDANDRRVVLVSLTTEGGALLQRVRTARHTRLRAMLDRLAEQERESLCALMTTYVGSLEE